MMNIFSGLLDLLNLFPSTQDVVAVYNKEYEQVFRDARPTKAMVKEDSTFMQHPIETGETIVDHRILLPVEVVLVVVTAPGKAAEVYQQIKQLYLRAEPLSVQTRVTTYTNLYIQAMPHEESPDMFDAVTLSLRLKEVQFVEAQYSELPPSKVKDKKDSSTVSKGTQTATTPTAAQASKASSTLYDWVIK